MSLKPPQQTQQQPTPPTAAPKPPEDEAPIPKVVFGIAKEGKTYLIVAVTEAGSRIIHKDDFRMSAEDELVRLTRRYWYDPEGVMSVVV